VTFTLTIRCDNDAFQPAPTWEVARILRHLADCVEDMELRAEDGERKTLRDANGNTVGHAEFNE
jgi:hypothetical protein